MNDRRPLRRLWLSIALIHALLAIGAAGLMVAGDRGLFEAIYLTVVILTTVGMEGPANDAERWSLVLMIAGVGTVIYATGQVVAFFVEGEVRDILGRHKVQNKINHLQDHFIVVGFGRMGQALCATLHCEGKPFVLIDIDTEDVAAAEALGYLVVTGDAKQEQTLSTAGIERSATLATCLHNDADNVFVTLSASGLKPGLHIVARAEDGTTIAKLQRAGAARVVCPPQIGAVRMSDMLQHPQVDDMIELDGVWPDLELSQLTAGRFPGMIGEQIADLMVRLGPEIVVVAMTTSGGERRLTPDRTTVLQSGDQLVLIGPRGWMAQAHPHGRHAA